MLENKLATLESLVVSTKTASEGSWQVNSFLCFVMFRFHVLTLDVNPSCGLHISYIVYFIRSSLMIAVRQMALHFLSISPVTLGLPLFQFKAGECHRSHRAVERQYTSTVTINSTSAWQNYLL